MINITGISAAFHLLSVCIYAGGKEKDSETGRSEQLLADGYRFGNDYRVPSFENVCHQRRCCCCWANNETASSIFAPFVTDRDLFIIKSLRTRNRLKDEEPTGLGAYRVSSMFLLSSLFCHPPRRSIGTDGTHLIISARSLSPFHPPSSPIIFCSLLSLSHTRLLSSLLINKLDY